MKMMTVNGIYRTRNVKNRLINWNGKSKSNFQKSVKDLLKKYWQYDAVFEEFPVYGTRYTLDFYNSTRKIAIEVQGGQHTKYNPFFHGKNPMELTHQYYKDNTKRNFCDINKIKLIEIFWNERKKLSDQFIQKLLNE